MTAFENSNNMINDDEECARRVELTEVRAGLFLLTGQSMPSHCREGLTHGQ